MATKFTLQGTEGGFISEETAKRWAARFRATMTNPDEIRAHFFGKIHIQELLDLKGSVGIRIYYAIDDDMKKQLLLVAADANGNNIIVPIPSIAEGTESLSSILDISLPCPTYCPTSGDL